MADNNLMTVSASPHVRAHRTTTGVMLDVILALSPSLVAALSFFGIRALWVVLVCVGTAVLSEFITRKILKRSTTIGDLSAVVTGLLLAFNLPVTIPLWMAAIGSVAAIVVVKQLFGGIGQNFANPAVVGRIILLVSFPSAMSNFTTTRMADVDAVTTATPLQALASGGEMPTLFEMFIGQRAGALGETCIVALIIGAVYLFLRGVIKPTIPFVFVGTVALIMLVYSRGDYEFVLYHIMSGGLVLGAVFMATDYTTSPLTTKGKIIFAIGCGVITCVIRLWGSLPEGVSYSILIMNILTPLIDKITANKPFGTVKEME
jgi:electron transport complex protein RnfD